MVRYPRGSKALKIVAGEYARVSHVDPKENRITIEREKGTPQTYDPRRFSGVYLLGRIAYQLWSVFYGNFNSRRERGPRPKPSSAAGYRAGVEFG